MKAWIMSAVFVTALVSDAQTGKPHASNAAHHPANHLDVAAAMGAPLPVGEVSSIDPHYRGMNLPAIYDILHRGLGEAKQSEYETKAQFDARIDKIRSLSLFGPHKIGDQYTFVLGGAWEGQGSVSAETEDSLASLRGAVQTSYDAETQILTVTVPSMLGLGSGTDQTSFGWGYSIRTTGHHVGQNAFGVRKVVAEGVTLQYTIEVDTADLVWLKPYCSKEFGSDIECRVPVAAAKARGMDGDVRVALGGTLEQPYTEEEKGTSKATIDNPFEAYEVERGLFVSPNQLVIYSGRTGEILAQYSDEAFQHEYPLHVEVSENKTPEWDNSLCTGYLVRDAPIQFYYQVDDGKSIDVFNPDKPIRLQAKRSVTLSVPFCFIPRLTVLRDGLPYRLNCETQSAYALNRSKCEAIGPP